MESRKGFWIGASIYICGGRSRIFGINFAVFVHIFIVYILG